MSSTKDFDNAAGVGDLDGPTDTVEPRSFTVQSGSALVWSSDYPKSSGRYWVRYHGQEKDIVSLTGDAGNLKQLFYGERVGLHNLPKEWSWQWAGPIPEPQEPNDQAHAPATKNL